MNLDDLKRAVKLLKPAPDPIVMIVIHPEDFDEVIENLTGVGEIVIPVEYEPGLYDHISDDAQIAPAIPLLPPLPIHCAEQCALGSVAAIRKPPFEMGYLRPSISFTDRDPAVKVASRASYLTWGLWPGSRPKN